tara:strand:+ start:460 stop:726 length:267 start_codon:yes stop_codon:yes gene_type:complete
MSGIVYENLPYPKGFYKDGRESKWYIDRTTQRVYRKVEIGESTRYVEQVSDIPSFIFGDISREHQKYLLRDRKKKSRNLDDLSAFFKF